MTDKMRPEGLKVTLAKLIDDYGPGFVITTIGSILMERYGPNGRVMQPSQSQSEPKATTPVKAEKKAAAPVRVMDDEDEEEDLDTLYFPITRKKGEKKWVRATDAQGKPLPPYIYSSVLKVYKSWLANPPKGYERRLAPKKKQK